MNQLNKLKRFIKSIPALRNTIVFLMNLKLSSFENSNKYWSDRYAKGGNSGAGSYGPLAQFKADVLNKFVRENEIQSVIELGCGDGNQLSLSKYPCYTGFDISADAINICNARFSEDSSKTFALMDDLNSKKSDLTISLDVVFHLVEDMVFQSYLDELFNAASKFAIIYSSNTEKVDLVTSKHVKHREFTSYIESKFSGWQLIEKINNKYPYNGIDEESSFADFYIYKKIK